MNKPSLKERFLYWFDNQMAKGSTSLIKLLTYGTVAVILLVTGIGIVMGLARDYGKFAFLWDSMATIINVELPYFEDSDGKAGYLILMTIATVCGLLVTSILIGIISSALEDRLNNLRRGNSRVLENNHIVVVGFNPGEYTLIRQLILAASGKPDCIVIADEMPREEMEEMIRDNVEIPKNIRIICRTVDIFDPVSLEHCSISSCRNVIISPTSDKETVKALLAVSLIINSATNDHVHVGAIISRDEYQFPESIARKHNVTTMRTNDVIAKIIAHSCTQPGLSDTFREVFNFEGSELYSIDYPAAVGMSFAELMRTMDDAVPIGFFRDDAVIMNPKPDFVCREGDRLLIFAWNRDSYSLTKDMGSEIDGMQRVYPHKVRDAGQVVILGYNESFATVLRELPYNAVNVLAECKRKYRDTVRSIAAEKEGVHITIYDKDINDDGALLKLAKNAAHIVLLSDHDLDEEDADMKVIFRIMHLRDIRTRYHLNFNITAEMRRESNQVLIQEDDNIDFVVASNMSSLFLAQLAESPELMDAFNELLCNEGNEFFLHTAHDLHCVGTNTIRYWRQILLLQGFILIGYINEGCPVSTFNPPLDETVEFSENDRLIVIGRE